MSQPAMSRRSVGPIAVQLGLITPEQLQAAQAAQARAPGRSLDQTLVDQRLLTPDQVRSIQHEMNKSAAPAAPSRVSVQGKPGLKGSEAHPSGPSHGTRRKVVATAPTSRKTWVLAGVMGLIPVLGLVGYLALGTKKAPEPPVEVVKKPVLPPGPTKDQKKDVAPPTGTKAGEPKVEDLRIRVTLRKLVGHSDVATRWNAAADKINSMRDPEQYKPVLSDLVALVELSKGTEHAEDVRDGFGEVRDAIKKRGEQVFGYISDESSRLSSAGKFGDAIKSWEWFPGNLDIAGTYQAKIQALQKKALDEARTYYVKLKTDVETLIKTEKLDEAHLLLERGLEIGIDEFVNDAQTRMVDLTLMRDGALKKAEEERLAQFEREKEASKEVAKAAALYQSQFMDFVSRRNFEGAKAFLAKQRAGASAEVVQALGSMEKVLDEIGAGFDLVAKNLSDQGGKTVSLAFLENGQQKNRSFMLKAVRDGKIVYLVENRELTVPLSDLHSSEIAKQAAAGPKEDKDFLDGLARFLDGGFDEAHVLLTSAGARAQGLVAFVEKSTVFLERNAPVMKERAARHVKDKEWERAIQEFTKLTSIASERKEALRGRARAYYQLNNFMGTVTDIESLFEMDDFSEPTIDLLNQAFKRSALIDKAIRMYEKANARVPKNASILANLVALYMQIHDFQKAKDTLGRAKDLQGGGQQLSQLVHLVTVALEPAFPGKTFKAQFGRYDVETNVSQEYATKMARFMDKVYQSYIKVFPYKKNETLRFHLKLFSSEGEFFSYYKRSTGADPQGPYGKILAYYMSLTKELVGWNADGIEETLQHEGLHQYFDYFISDCPIWFNEGYASFFETSTADEVKFNPGRHNTAKWLYVQNQLPSMKEIFMMSGDVFRAKGALHYGSSWSVVYWFVKSGRKQVLDRYFEALMEGKDQQQAFDAIFGAGKENIDELDAKWRKAIRTDNYDE
ncbi:MAG TPA: DUF1570 domain-containing protein [Planctomycetota bacterium]|nr:DUF1570 domain-containing protein [Planctomycetota bacterium]